MSGPQGRRRRGLTWAIIGGLVLVAGIAAVILVPLITSNPAPDPTDTTPTDTTPTADPTDTPTGEFVDETASERGWVAEPITTDAETYVRAALAAAASFDTTKSDRGEWLSFLDTWFTPDTRYTSPDEQQEAMEASQLELRQAVVLPEQEWDSLTREDGRVEAKVEDDVELAEVPDDQSGDMHIGTADVTLTFTRSDSSGEETSYDEQVTVSVQVLCGTDSVPTPDSGQRAGDCKVIRFFSEPQEP
ncbi:hypothetical protein [Microbacterium immunditiarum]|uniref:Uncharacterized protein n=1 Tax=Microbacterium immunditiarum TaxID=337480 RepID=A0A7Y9KJQ1_9MICO|nr:hypothetical protein [Microbacterium immunditiarum]NYE18009.1 hypothetical protein [Microbacterium immunditiarum]